MNDKIKKVAKRVKFFCPEAGVRGWISGSKIEIIGVESDSRATGTHSKASLNKYGELRKHHDHIDNTYGHNGKEILVDCPNGSGNLVWLPINELLPIEAPPATPESLNPDLGLESAKKELPTKNCIHCGNKFSYDPRYQTEESAKKCQDCFGKENDKWQIEQKKRKEYEKSKKHPKNIDPTFPSGSRFDIEDPLAVPRNINDLESAKECPCGGKLIGDTTGLPEKGDKVCEQCGKRIFIAPKEKESAKECPDCHGTFEGAEGATCPTCGRFSVQKEALRPALPPQILNRRQEVNASGREWAVRLDGRVLDGRYLTEAEAIKALDSIPSIAFDNGEVVYSLDVPDTEQEQHYKYSSLNKVAYIVKRKDGWHVLSEKGKNLGGPYSSREKAKLRLKQVEYFKHQGVFRPFSKQVYAEVLTDPYQTLSTHITEMRTRMDQVNERLQNAPAVKTAKEDAAPEMDLAALFADLTQGIDLLETKLGGDDIEPELHKGVEELENKLWTLEEKLGLTPKLSEHEKAEPEHKEVVEKAKEMDKEAAVVTDETIEETTNDPSLANPSLTPIPPPLPGIQNIQPTDQDNLEVPVVKPSSPPAPGQVWVYNPDVNAYVSMPDPAAPGKTI